MKPSARSWAMMILLVVMTALGGCAEMAYPYYGGYGYGRNDEYRPGQPYYGYNGYRGGEYGAYGYRRHHHHDDDDD